MKKNNKHAGIPAVALLLAAVLLLLSLPIGAEETDSGAMPVIDHCIGAYLYNFENDEVLYSVGADERVYPTSTVKLMTGIVAIEELGDDLSRQVTITAEMLSKVAGNNVGLLAGEVVTVEQLLYAMLVNSANDAAMVLAYAACGSVEAFVERMNEKANTLGAYDTYYANPTGMHNDAMVTTVADTAIIAKYAYTLPLFMEIVSTPKYVMEATNLSDYRNIYNRNCLLSKYYNVNYPYPRATGMNAGATTQGGLRDLCDGGGIVHGAVLSRDRDGRGRGGRSDLQLRERHQAVRVGVPELRLHRGAVRRPDHLRAAGAVVVHARLCDAGTLGEH